jgi:hypothetical protein
VIVRAVAAMEMPHYVPAADSFWCNFCERASEIKRTFQHADGCLWVQAHTLLAGQE